MRTRHQKAQQEKDGVPPTPPQELGTNSRSRRNARSNVTRADSSEPDSVTAPLSTTRGGRVGKKTRGPNITKPKAAKNSERTARTHTPTLNGSATHSEASSQHEATSDLSNEVQAPGATTGGVAEDMEDTPRPREIPNVPQTPVVAQPVQVPWNMTLSPISSISSPPDPSVSPLDAQHAPASLSSPTTFAKQSPESTRPKKLGSASSTAPLSATATTFKEALDKIDNESSSKVSRVSSDDPTIETQNQQTVQKTQAVTPQLPLPSTSTVKSHKATSAQSSSSSTGVDPDNDSLTKTPAFDEAPSPSITPKNDMRNPASFIYNYPERDQEKTHTAIKFCVDVQIIEALRKLDPLRSPAMNVSIPSSMLPDVLNFIADHPDARDSALQHLTTAHPVAKMVTSELTNGAIAGMSRSRRETRTKSNGVLQDPMIRATTRRARPSVPPKKSTHFLRDNFGALQARKLRERHALNEFNAQARMLSKHSTSENLTPKTKTVEQWYDEKGNLTLGVFKEVPIEPVKEDSSDEQMTEDHDTGDRMTGDNDPGDRMTEDHDTGDRMTEDNDTGDRMTLVNDTADRMSEGDDQHVASIAEEPTTQAAAVPQTPQNRGWRFGNLLPSAARTVSRFIPGFGRQAMSTPQQHTQPQRAATTEPRPHVSVTQGRSAVTSAVGPSAERHDSSKKMLLTKGEAEARRKAKKDREWYEAQLKKLKEEDAKKEETIQSLKSKVYFAARGATETNPCGIRRPKEKKRKRRSSPDSIPNPKGASYGMDLDYFGWVSSDSDTESTASHPPSSKRIRHNASDTSEFVDSFNANPHTILPGETSASKVIGDPFRATPYTGTTFAIKDSPKHHDGGNVFNEERSVAKAEPTKSTPEPCYNSFRVPSPGSSDDEDEDDELYDPSISQAQPATVSPISLPTSSLAQATTSAVSPPTPNATSSVEVAKPDQSMAPPAHPGQILATFQPNNIPSATEISLNIQRERALKYATKKPSRLQQSSRLSTSTIASDAQAEDEEQYEPPSATQKGFNNQTFGDPSSFDVDKDADEFQSYYDYVEGVPERIFEVIEKTWDNVDSEIAGARFEQDFAAFMEQDQTASTSSAPAQVRQQTNTITTPRVLNATSDGISAQAQAYIDSKWTKEDDEAAVSTFEREFAAYEAGLNTGADLSATT